MRRQADWTRALVLCKNSVKKRISPILATVSQPQPSLGIGAGGDPIRQVDLVAESAIVDALKSLEISFTLISEESGIKEYGKHPSENYVTVDPIDGTTNLIRGIPFYATSIAVSTEPTLASVHTALVEDLFHDVTYTAKATVGAFRSGQKITPSTEALLEESVIGMDLNSYRVERIAPRLTSIIKRTKHIRHLGANALELCYVADGTTEAFIDIRGKLRTTDVAAACLILREAGAKMTTLQGIPLDANLSPTQKVEFIAAANGKIHQVLLDLMEAEKEAL